MSKAGLGLLVLAVASVWTIPVLSQSARTTTVIVKETQLRAGQSFFAETLETLAYEDEVEVLGRPRTEDAWVRSRTASGQEGWVHRSALEMRRLVFRAGSDDARRSADTDEVALAARGFNEDVEASYKSEQELDYAWVDKMEEAGVELEVLREFMDEGGLSLPEGGDR